MARKIVDATKKAGAEGGTTCLGKGTGTHEIAEIFGIPFEPEKEIVLTLISEDKLEDVLNAVVSTGKLDKPGKGIAFVVNVKKVTGICHPCALKEARGEFVGGTEMEEGREAVYDLIVTIVNKGDSERVISCTRNLGATGGTIIFGRGTGVHEHVKLFGITIEPEKEIVLTLIKRELTQKVLEAIEKEVELEKPGKGIAFVLDVDRVAGINHDINNIVKDEKK
ncbi:MAG: P-II family nitrogen regulator [Clostridia bacterium]|nr:P-II family nitrogen regulator [Clostridia bacterium]